MRMAQSALGSHGSPPRRQLSLRRQVFIGGSTSRNKRLHKQSKSKKYCRLWNKDAEFQLLLVLTDALGEEWESEEASALESETGLDPGDWTAGERRRFVEKARGRIEV